MYMSPSAVQGMPRHARPMPGFCMLAQTQSLHAMPGTQGEGVALPGEHLVHLKRRQALVCRLLLYVDASHVPAV